ncbi:Zinc finger, PMZ-type [Corchorus capsularis]|uniref:Zinc finger, PMZ-type n=1 Tax=Corchorus capsularis TaxID=210143 RepID=A0A1R3I2A4_COCAP|nr:Zinc finger, PMZ-type [Corchorus capsularis]
MDCEYILRIYHGGRFVRDPDLRTLRYREMGYVYFRDPDDPDFNESMRLVWDDSSTIRMINAREKYGEIDLYVDHLDENPEVVQQVDDGLNAVGGEGLNAVGGEPGINAVGSEGLNEAPQVGVEIEVDAEVYDALGDANLGAEDEVAEAEEEVENDFYDFAEAEGDESEVQSDDEDGDKGVFKDGFSVRVRGLSDGENDEELQRALNRKLKKGKGPQIRISIPVEGVSENENDHLLHYVRLQQQKDVGEGTSHQVEDNYESDHYKEPETKDDEYPRYDPSLDLPEFETGMFFTDVYEFRAAIRNFDKRSGGFQVKDYIDNHTCCENFTNKAAKASMVAEKMYQTIRDNPKMSLKQIQAQVSTLMHVDINLRKVMRVKKKVRDEVAGNYKQEFSMLWDYANELLTKNPGSTIKLSTQRVTQYSPIHFRRLYICLDALKRGWKEGCRPILGIDGCFLKGPYKCQVITAVGKDANDQMYPVCWAVAETENREVWEWFLNLLKDDFDMCDGLQYTFISDQHKGLESAMKEVLPRAKHRNCARHVFSNWSGRLHGKTYEAMYWQIVKASTPVQWEERFDLLKLMDKTRADELKAKQKNPKLWTRAFYGEECKCDMVDNNCCEAFNSVILDARTKVIITMLEEIRVQTMTRILQKREWVHTWHDDYGPLVKEKFAKQKKEGIDWRMVSAGEFGCEIKKGRCSYIVDLKARTCTCRNWQISGIPCAHACSAIWRSGGDPDEYLHPCYHKDTYIKTYSYGLKPINGPHEWVKTGKPALLPPIIPRAPPGRPKMNRRKGKNEPKKTPTIGKLSKKGTQNSCTLCGGVGHNIRSCQLRASTNGIHAANIETRQPNPILGVAPPPNDVGPSGSKGKGPLKPKAKAPPSTKGQGRAAGIVISEGRNLQTRPRTEATTQEKGKKKVVGSKHDKGKKPVECQNEAHTFVRPCRQRKPSFKAMGLASGYSTCKTIAATKAASTMTMAASTMTRAGSTSATHSLTTNTQTKGKRKRVEDPVGTQESIKKKK